MKYSFIIYELSLLIDMKGSKTVLKSNQYINITDLQ